MRACRPVRASGSKPHQDLPRWPASWPPRVDTLQRRIAAGRLPAFRFGERPL